MSRTIVGQERVEVSEHLVIDPEVCHGHMTFRGTRIPVATALAMVAKGHSIERLTSDWPQLSAAALAEAIALASAALHERYGQLAGFNADL